MAIFRENDTYKIGFEAEFLNNGTGVAKNIKLSEKSMILKISGTGNPGKFESHKIPLHLSPGDHFFMPFSFERKQLTKEGIKKLLEKYNQEEVEINVNFTLEYTGKFKLKKYYQQHKYRITKKAAYIIEKKIDDSHHQKKSQSPENENDGPLGVGFHRQRDPSFSESQIGEERRKDSSSPISHSKKLSKMKLMIFFYILAGLCFIGTIVFGNKGWELSQKRIIQQEEKESDPNPTITMHNTERMIHIILRAQHNIANLSFYIPVLGKVTDITDDNTLPDAHTTLKKVTGWQTSRSQNIVEIIVENIKPNINLSWTVHYEPMRMPVRIGSADRFEIAYSWNYEGNTFNNEKWISFSTGKEVNRPSVRVSGVVDYGSLTPEEKAKGQQTIIFD